MRLVWAHAMRWLAGTPRPVRVLLCSDERFYTSEQQWAPVWRWAGGLARRCGVVLCHRRIEPGRPDAVKHWGQFDLIGLKLGFTTPQAEAVAWARQLRGQLAGPAARLVYFDGDDDLNVQWPELLGEVDRYVKKHAFADRSAYLRSYQGKSNLTDHLSRTQGLVLTEHAVQASEPLNADQLGKISVGWNIGLDDKIVDLFRSLPEPRLDGRSVDIASRAYVPPTLWTHGLRAPVVEQLERMSARFRVMAPRDRVGQAQYYRELLDAKLCVSPFGFGEICWRDFEAILCGCVLVKPDMGHVRTQPDLFIPGETYLPVRWDYADLAEQCEQLLADDARRQAMARRARSVLAQALGEDWFLSRFTELLPSLPQGKLDRRDAEISRKGDPTP
ncbi:glycosyltransferase family protein [Ideonella oryzae]|uniref:Glycosyltransferase n=1 Tax=Ideonella oryzae TaxID=2937441 RepID=A0ABT1BTN7_9BURK|nr:glycosyltransferase [Ideonella oryzae]MCO5978911.1 glycosyltransferase [Ideonella oryzae]